MKCPNCNLELIHRPIDPIDVMHCPICPFVITPNKKKVDCLYTVLSVDKNGIEGIMAIKKFGTTTSMTATRKDLLEPFITDKFKKELKDLGMECIIAKFKRVK